MTEENLQKAKALEREISTSNESLKEVRSLQDRYGLDRAKLAIHFSGVNTTHLIKGEDVSPISLKSFIIVYTVLLEERIKKLQEEISKL